jgi:hypothetical protein
MSSSLIPLDMPEFPNRRYDAAVAAELADTNTVDQLRGMLDLFYARLSGSPIPAHVRKLRKAELAKVVAALLFVRVKPAGQVGTLFPKSRRPRGRFTRKSRREFTKNAHRAQRGTRRLQGIA